MINAFEALKYRSDEHCKKPLKKLIILSTEQDLNVVEKRMVLHVDGPTEKINQSIEHHGVELRSGLNIRV